MRELRRSFGVLGEAQWFWGLGGVGGGRLVLKNGFLPLEQRPPQYYGGAVPQRAILLVAASCKKWNIPIWGCDGGRSQYK